jgi:hypothetical protein
MKVPGERSRASSSRFARGVVSINARGVSADRVPAVDEFTSPFGGGCPASEEGEAVRGGAVLGCRRAR